jgi:hypothetical protein
LLALDFRFARDLVEVLAIDDAETTGFLQVADENGFGLPSEAIDSVREQATHVARAIVELTDHDGTARAAVGRGRRRRGGLGRLERLMRLGRTGGEPEEQHGTGGAETFDARRSHPLLIRIVPHD